MVDNVYKTQKTRMNTHFFLTTSVAQVCSRLKEVFVDKKKRPRCWNTESVLIDWLT